MSRLLRWNSGERNAVYAAVATHLPEYMKHKGKRGTGYDLAWLFTEAQKVLPKHRQHSKIGDGFASYNFRLALEYLRQHAPEQAAPQPEGGQLSLVAAEDAVATASDRLTELEQQLAQTRSALEDAQQTMAALQDEPQSEVDGTGISASWALFDRTRGDVSLGGVLLGSVIEFGIQALVGILRNEDVVNAVRALNNDAPKYQRHNPFAMDWAPKEGKLKIAVVGVEPRQRQDLLNDPEFADFDIKCWTKDESTDKLAAMVRKADVVIEVMFVRHQVTQMARDAVKNRETYHLEGYNIGGLFPRFVMARGTIGSVKQYLRDVAAHNTAPPPVSNGAAQPEQRP